MIDITDALKTLCPNSTWALNGTNYNDIVWMNAVDPKPTEAEVTAEVQRLQAEYDNNEYQRLRAAEYPPITDYLDGVVKGDQAQIDKYIADCQAVKDKYPKGI